jgi:hypothetical protein
MLKNKLIFVALFCILKIFEATQSRWIFSCSTNKCELALIECTTLNCSGNDECIKCVNNIDISCNQCIQQIYEPSSLVNDEFICTINSDLDNKVCEIFCRGQFYHKGKCLRNTQNIPRCLCSDKLVDN